MKRNFLWKKWMVVLAVFAVILSAACSTETPKTATHENNQQPKAGQGERQQEEGNGQGTEAVIEEPAEPVTINVFTFPTRIPEEDFALLFTNPVKEKYPHITVQPLYGNTGNREEILLFSEEKADLLIFWNGEMSIYEGMDILQDMRPLFQKYDVDVGRFQSELVGTVKGKNGEIYGLPYNVNVMMLYYNKSIFDRFGVDYPEDGMFWEDVVELAANLSRTEDGVEYLGYHYDNYFRLSSPLSLAEVDDASMKANLNTDGWRKALSMVQTIDNIPGNNIHGKGNYRKLFIEDQVLAMTGAVNILHLLTDDQTGGLDWDIAQYPSWKDNPNRFGYADLHEIGVTKITENEEAAMQVLEVFLSDDVQLDMVRKTGRVSPLAGEMFAEQFGAEVPHLQGKHIEGIFKSRPAAMPEEGISKYWGHAHGILNKYVGLMRNENLDVNTAILRAEEEINQYLEAIEQ